MAKATKKLPTDGLLAELRAFGLAYPGAHLKSPWPGHLDLAVNDKTFAYLSVEGEPLKISCKLPRSSEVALMLPFCQPTAYGLGKSGWVSASFDDADVDVGMLKAWIDESYRAQAPKKLVASLGAPVTGDAATATATARDARPAPRRAAAKPDAKPATRPAAKPAAKPAARPAAKPDAKPAKRAAAKPAARRAAAKPARRAAARA